MKNYFYVITNILNGKKYYGSGSKKNYFGSGELLWKAINKYGITNFTIITLKEFDTREDAFAFEDRFLKLYKISSLPNTYNCKDAGEGGDTSKYKTDEEKKIINEKRSQSLKLYYKTHQARITTEETRKKQSDAKIGKSNGPRSSKVKEKIRNTMTGISYSEERKENMRAANKQRPLIKCPYCGLEGKKHRNMTLYHFDNCKLKQGVKTLYYTRTESVLRGDIATRAMDPDCVSCEA